MAKNEIISPYFENGVFAGVRVTIGDEDFVIARKDYQNGREMTWLEAMDALKANNLDTWNYRQICLTMAYRKEVDKVLVDNGGDSLDKWYWTCAECAAYTSFIYNGYIGYLYYNVKRNTFSVRPVLALAKS